MLEVGDPGGLTLGESRVQFASWVITSSNMLIGASLRSMDPGALAILKSGEVLDLTRDKGGLQGGRVSTSSPEGPECWAKNMTDGSIGAVLINRATVPGDVTCTWADLGLPEGTVASVRDLWAGRD